MHPQIPGLTDWKPLARGGFAVVWQARQAALDRPVAVKVYPPELDEGDRRRLLREAAIAGRLSGQPGIVTVHDAGTLPDERHYLIMELCPGGSLTQWLEPEHRVGEERVRQLGVRLADALAAAHALGVLHGDIKPANILLDRYGNPALGDFGLAAETGAGPGPVDALRFTPAYAPPEMLDLRPPTAAGDVFSLAATLYALLAGRPPRDVSLSRSLNELREAAARPIDPLPGVNWYLMDALLGALASDPAARPSAVGFRDQLAGVPANRTASRVPAGAHHHALAGTLPTPPPVRRRGAFVLAAVFVTVIGSATAWLVAEPASSGAPASLTQTAVPGRSPASPEGSAALDSAGTSADRSTDTAGSRLTKAQAIQLSGSSDSAKPFQAVRISGTYRGGPATFLRVQRWERGRWVAFPVPSKTDEAGQFTAYVELGQPGRYRLRVLDLASGVASEPFVLVVRG